MRMPKKLTGGHRGFGFVEFATHDDALRAKNILRDSHLYGRHLVIEWAEDTKDLTQIGKRAMKGVTASRMAGRSAAL